LGWVTLVGLVGWLLVYVVGLVLGWLGWLRGLVWFGWFGCCLHCSLLVGLVAVLVGLVSGLLVYVGWVWFSWFGLVWLVVWFWLSSLFAFSCVVGCWCHLVGCRLVVVWFVCCSFVVSVPVCFVRSFLFTLDWLVVLVRLFVCCSLLFVVSVWIVRFVRYISVTVGIGSRICCSTLFGVRWFVRTPVLPLFVPCAFGCYVGAFGVRPLRVCVGFVGAVVRVTFLVRVVRWLDVVPFGSRLPFVRCVPLLRYVPLPFVVDLFVAVPTPPFRYVGERSR